MKAKYILVGFLIALVASVLIVLVYNVIEDSPVYIEGVYPDGTRSVYAFSVWFVGKLRDSCLFKRMIFILYRNKNKVVNLQKPQKNGNVSPSKNSTSKRMLR